MGDSILHVGPNLRRALTILRVRVRVPLKGFLKGFLKYQKFFKRLFDKAFNAAFFNKQAFGYVRYIGLSLKYQTPEFDGPYGRGP